MDLLRFSVFVAWCVCVLLGLAYDLTDGRAGVEVKARGAHRLRRGLVPLMAAFFLFTVGVTVAVLRLDRRSRDLAGRASTYYDLCVKHSPKAHPELAGENNEKYLYYKIMYSKYLEASGRPWALLAADPPEP